MLSKTVFLVIVTMTASFSFAQTQVDVSEASIRQLQNALEDGNTTSVNLVTQYLKRIAA